MKKPINWRSTLLGALGGALGSFATIANLDQLNWWQTLLAFTASFLFALQGALTADAKPVRELTEHQPPANPVPCPMCGK